MGGKVFVLHNRTDGVPASPDEFESVEAALRYADSFRQRYAAQGYYLTAEGYRIDPEDVELEVLPAEE